MIKCWIIKFFTHFVNMFFSTFNDPLFEWTNRNKFEIVTYFRHQDLYDTYFYEILTFLSSWNFLIPSTEDFAINFILLLRNVATKHIFLSSENIFHFFISLLIFISFKIFHYFLNCAFICSFIFSDLAGKRWRQRCFEIFFTKKILWWDAV